MKHVIQLQLRRYSPLLIAALVGAAITACQPVPPPSPPTPLPTPVLPYPVSRPFCTIPVSGTLHALEPYPPKYVQLFTDAKQLSKQLANALPSGPDKDTFSLDRIDFARQVLLSIEWGPNSDCGPVLQVNDIQVNANRVAMDVTKVEPPPDTMRQAAISSAFAYVLLPRQALNASVSVTVVVTDNFGTSITNTFSLK